MAPISTPRVGWPTMQQVGVVLHLARQHQLLLIAAGEGLAAFRSAIGVAGRRIFCIFSEADVRLDPALGIQEAVPLL